MIKVIVVDDEKGSRELLVSLLNDFVDGVKVIAEADSALEAKKVIESNQFDALFLDVEMPKIDGFGLLYSLKQIDFEVIFTTAHSKYAIKAIKEEALGYLLKPVQVDEILLVIDKLKKRLKDQDPLKLPPIIIPEKQDGTDSTSKKIALPLSKGYKMISISDVIYCESNGAYTIFRIVNGQEILVAKHLKNFESAFAGQGMVRIHNQYMININHLDSYNRTKGPGGEVLLSNGKEIPVSRGKRSNLLSKINEFKVSL